MNVLGINQIPGMLAWQHDSAAALVKDGKLIAAVEEERFNRVRHSRNYPSKAIKFCLDKGGITLKDVDIIAISYNPYAFMKRWPINFHPKSLIQHILNLGLFLIYKRSVRKETDAKVVYIDHHLAHASSAHRASGFSESNSLTIDGSGETESFAFFVCRDGVIKRKWGIQLDGLWGSKKWRSIGLVYSRVSNFLGLGVHSEGKTMGLASYGEPRFDFSKILNITRHNKFKIDRRLVLKMYPHVERKRKDSIDQIHKDFAASLQKALEDSIVNLAREAYEYSGICNFTLAGGVALNCNTNTKLLEQDFVDNIFIQPAANDGGAALGAALEVAARFGESADFKMEHAYWGPEFNNDEIETALIDAKTEYEQVDNPAQVAAKLVREGELLCWFQGAAELGPRALGNRSIIGDPTRKGIDDKINKYVKHREQWRPFAPSVAEEDVHKYFKIVKSKESSSPYMLHVFYVRDKHLDKLPSITHIDGSSRIQTVRKDQNPRYYELIKEFEKLSGYSIVLNTSFNDAGEPIVTTPKDALRCFFGTGLDVMVIGNFLVRK